jgi:hypothetical protein
VPRDHPDALAEALDQARVVRGVVPGGGVRAGQHLAAEALRGLHRAQAGAVHGAAHGEGALGAEHGGLDGVGHGEHRDDGGQAGEHRVHHGGDGFGRGQGAGGVVHEHDLVVLGGRREGERDGLLPGGAAGDDDHPGAEPGEHPPDLGHALVRGRGGHDDQVDAAGGEQPAHRVQQDRLAADRAQGLGGTGTEPLTTPGRRN